jgi:hypothetical protein
MEQTGEYGNNLPQITYPHCRSFKTFLRITKGIGRTVLSELKTIRPQLEQGRLLLPRLYINLGYKINTSGSDGALGKAEA